MKFWAPLLVTVFVTIPAFSSAQTNVFANVVDCLIHTNKAVATMSFPEEVIASTKDETSAGAFLDYSNDKEELLIVTPSGTFRVAIDQNRYFLESIEADKMQRISTELPVGNIQLSPVAIKITKWIKDKKAQRYSTEIKSLESGSEKIIQAKVSENYNRDLKIIIAKTRTRMRAFAKAYVTSAKIQAFTNATSDSLQETEGQNLNGGLSHITMADVTDSIRSCARVEDIIVHGEIQDLKELLVKFRN